MLMKLANDDKAFFTLVSAAAFSNPFGDERADIDRRVADQYAGPGGGPDLTRMLRHLDTRLASLESKQRGRASASTFERARVQGSRAATTLMVAATRSRRCRARWG
jgi:hypothetical protein